MNNSACDFMHIILCFSFISTWTWKIDLIHWFSLLKPPTWSIYFHVISFTLFIFHVIFKNVINLLPHAIFSWFIFHNSWLWFKKKILPCDSFISTLIYICRTWEFIYCILITWCYTCLLEFTYAISGQYMLKLTFT